jgi:hypothetical protein
MLIIKKNVLDRRRQSLPSAIGFKISQRSGAPLTQLSPKICLREKDAAKIHRASRGAAHNHTSMDGAFWAIEDVFIAEAVFSAWAI